MLKKILVGLAVVVLLFVIVVAMQPADFRIARSIAISAPPGEVFSQVNDFHAWQSWSPWAKLDPNSKTSFEGPEAGTGTIFTWDGNNQVGQGRMTIIESRPDDLIRIQLDFERPFKDTSVAEFTFKGEGDQTKVTWSMSGHKGFLNKAICLFMNMDKMVGGEFEKGLQQIKENVESVANPTPAG